MRGVLGGLADAHRAGQAPARPPQPAADGRAHQPPRPARAELAGGVPARLPGLGGARLPRPLLPGRHGEAHHRGGPAHPHRLPRELLEVCGRARGGHGPAARGPPAPVGGDREGGGLHQPLPLPGHQGPPGAEPHQAAGQGRAHRDPGRAQEDPLQVPRRSQAGPGGAGAQGHPQGLQRQDGAALRGSHGRARRPHRARGAERRGQVHPDAHPGRGGPARPPGSAWKATGW